MNEQTRQDVPENPTGSSWLAVVLPLGFVAVAWAYWDPWSQTTTLGKIAHDWSHKPIYSHGYLIPLFAGALLWMRREEFKSHALSPSWWGLLLVVFAAILRLLGAYYFFDWLDFVSLLPMLAGLCLLVGGKHLLRWAAPSIAFLLFMIPLPYRVETGLREPLQRVGTISSCYLMQTLGLPAYPEGNQIHGVTDHPLEVEEACSGLGMMMVFFALSAAVVYLISQRPLWERGLVLLSAAPIAVAANVLRITTTGVLFALGYHRAAEILHEHLSALLMMPVALGLLWLELWFFTRLVILEEDQPMSAKLQLQPAALESQIPVSAGR